MLVDLSLAELFVSVIYRIKENPAGGHGQIIWGKYKN